jgi:hypothetical protein
MVNVIERLIASVEEGDTYAINHWLDQGSDIHVHFDYPLRRSVEQCYTKAVELLLDRGADVHAYNEYALFASVHRKHFDITKLLLDHNADYESAMDYYFSNCNFSSAAFLMKVKFEQTLNSKETRNI